MVHFFLVLMCAMLGYFINLGDFSKSYADTAETMSRDFSYQLRNRRDPFLPLHRRGTIAPKTPPTIQSLPDDPRPMIVNPDWKLLGVIHGTQGPQAVIQVSPQERVFARKGAEVIHSGWVIKNIGREEVQLEHFSQTAFGEDLNGQKLFILSFPSRRTSS